MVLDRRTLTEVLYIEARLVSRQCCLALVDKRAGASRISRLKHPQVSQELSLAKPGLERHTSLTLLSNLINLDAHSEGITVYLV